MIPTNVILDAIVDLLAGDTTTLAPAVNGLKLHLAKVNFTPSPTLVIGDLTEATFDGHTALVADAGDCQVYTDPVSGLRVLQIKEPLDGWFWQVAGTTDLPQQIFGIYLTDNGSTALYASAKFTTPFNLTAVGQAINVSSATLTFQSGSPV
jgi:hypothetical protein